VVAELVAVLEVELVLARLLDGHRQRQAVLGRELRDVRAELLVDQHAGGARVDAALDRLLHALEDQLLGVRDRLGLFLGRIALDPEHLLLERASMIEGQDVQLSVVAEGHRQYLAKSCGPVSLVLYAATWSRSSPAPRTRSGSRRS
jgi:hypothetical protein